MFCSPTVQAQNTSSGFDEILNTTILYVAVREPSNDPDNTGDMITLQKVGTIVWDNQVVGDVTENHALSVQPRIKMVDDSVSFARNSSTWNTRLDHL